MRSEPIVPLISSSVAGPLGILHLPRLWLKLLLHASGRLPEGYRHGSGGFDEAFFAHFDLGRDSFVEFVETERPDYPTVERYVREHATKLDQATIASFNHLVRTENNRDETAAERRKRFGIEDPTFKNGVALNDLDDWATFHTMLFR